MTNDGARSARQTYGRLTANIKKVMRGQDHAVRTLLAGFFSGGHILLEDVPGTGKTTLAKALARSIDADFKRIQFTPDLLPSDILGVSIYSQHDHAFHLHRGPVFTNIVLADEINRASPRTQSALLEAMGEMQVSIDGQLHPLPNLFFVIATQNPVETHGTYPLPESQMDRFALQFSLGYVSPEDEVAIFTDQTRQHPIKTIEPCVTTDEVMQLKLRLREVRISDELMRYCVDIVAATRDVTGVHLGAGPRATLALLHTARALALFDGLEFITPDHIQEIAVPVIAHRLVLDPQARFSGATARIIVDDILQAVPVPA